MAENESAASRTSLGSVGPAPSRHSGRRSAVATTGECVVTGTADGSVVAYERDGLAERWRVDDPERDPAIVAATSYDGGVVVGERSARGVIRCHDPDTGAVRWRYATTDDVDAPQRDTRFFLPFVVALESAGERLYAVSRRYERTPEAADGDRAFRSVVYAFDPDGSLAWTYDLDASVIALDADQVPDADETAQGERERSDGRVAVACNRCPGDHQLGLVVLDAETGGGRYDWDPGTDGQRRVGDVSLVDDGVVLTSHGDYRGYRLDDGGTERWRVDLATPIDRGDETLYAYPNHVHATAGGVVFVTGNTYAVESRETNGLHPDEHTAFGYGLDGQRQWSATVGGFANEIATHGSTVAVPSAQNFRRRDPDQHGLTLLDAETGPRRTVETDGIVTAVAVDGDVAAAVEEPVVYHDDGTERGAYHLRTEVRRDSA